MDMPRRAKVQATDDTTRLFPPPLVGARLTREEAVSVDISVICYAAFAGKPRSYRGGADQCLVSLSR
ncbi:hypothetical protein PMI18_03402 [Pseudomonas sp. GM102]|nr:hypothetical protein PMI18_03402 [Pseudomonas sp. GM102]